MITVYRRFYFIAYVLCCTVCIRLSVCSAGARNFHLRTVAQGV